MSRKSIQAVFACFALLEIWGAPAHAETHLESAVRNFTSRAQTATDKKCACRDLACAREKVDEGMWAQGECVAAVVDRFLPGAEDIFSSFKAVQGLDLNELVREAEFATDLLKKAPSADYPELPECLEKIKKPLLEASKKLQPFAAFAKDVSLANAYELIDPAIEAAPAVAEAIEAVTNLKEECEISKLVAGTQKGRDGLKQTMALFKRLRENKTKDYFKNLLPAAKKAKGFLSKIASTVTGKTAGTLFTCLKGFNVGLTNLYENGACMIDDLRQLKASMQATNKSVRARANALGSNLENHAKWTVCNKIFPKIKIPTFTDPFVMDPFKRCQKECVEESRNAVSSSNQLTRSRWQSVCLNMCALADDSLGWYPSPSLCKTWGMDGKNETHKFRDLPLAPLHPRPKTDAEEGKKVKDDRRVWMYAGPSRISEAEERRRASEGRRQFLVALDTLENHFDLIAGSRETISQRDLERVAGGKAFSSKDLASLEEGELAKITKSAEFLLSEQFGREPDGAERKYPGYFYFLSTAGPAKKDLSEELTFTKEDIAPMRREVATFKSEHEYEKVRPSN